MRLRFILIFQAFLVAACNHSEKHLDKINETIAEIQKKYAPDQREARFDIKASIFRNTLILTGESDSEEAKSELLRQIEKFPLKTEDRISLLPDSTIGLKPFALVTVSVANFRSSPSHSSELLTQALMGTPVKLLKKEGGWHLSQTPDHYIAWVDNNGIFPVTADELKYWQKAERLIITDDYGTIKSLPDENSANVSDYTMGMILENIGKQNNYFEVKIPDGRTGFIPEEVCEDFHRFRSGIILRSDGLISVSQYLYGRSYLWGGTSVAGMDCSGFIKMAFYMNGVILSRDASLQARHGKVLTTSSDYNNFQPGDLLFFGRKATAEKPERITHVGMIVEGKKFIHESGIVRFNSLDPGDHDYSEYRHESFVKAVRIIGHRDDYGIQQLGHHPWY